jgi:membrane protease YdiL (CAAX protease family)
MNGAIAGVKRAFWNGNERRLRALFRIPAVVGLVLLAAQFINALLQAVAGVVAIPGPLFATLWIGLLTVAVAAIAWFVDRRHRHDMGLKLDRRWWLDAAAGLAAGLGMVATVVAALWLAGMATFGGAYRVENPAVVLGGGSAAGALLTGLAFFVAVATLEEVVVRGYLLTNVAEGVRGYVGTDRVAVWAAVLGTAGLFGVLHAANPGGTALSFLNIALAGILLGVAYTATGRLGFPIGLHVTWNFGLGPLFGLPVSGLATDTALVPVRVDGPTLVTGGEFGPEGGLVMFTALAAGTGLLAWWLSREGDDLSPDERVAIPDLWVDEPADT